VKKNPVIIGFLQAAGLATYISMVVLLIKSQPGPDEPGFLGILLVLTLFATSALISGVITLGYPIYLAWKQKELKLAIKTVVSTAGWLILFVLTLIVTVLAG